MTAQAVDVLQPDSNVGSPDNALLCYVELQGQWQVGNPFGGPPTKFTKVFEVFDAYTGNVLVIAARP